MELQLSCFQKFTNLINLRFGHRRLSFGNAKISRIDMFKSLDAVLPQGFFTAVNGAAIQHHDPNAVTQLGFAFFSKAWIDRKSG